MIFAVEALACGLEAALFLASGARAGHLLKLQRIGGRRATGGVVENAPGGLVLGSGLQRYSQLFQPWRLVA